MMEFIEKQERFYEAGVEILGIRLSLPQVGNKAEINRFYRELLALVYSFCTSELLPYAKERYRTDPDERKKFHFVPYRYRLEGKIMYQDENFLSIRMDACYTGGGEKAPLGYKSGSQNWDLKEEMLLSPVKAMLAFGEKIPPGKERRQMREIFFTERGMFYKKGREWIKRKNEAADT